MSKWNLQKLTVTALLIAIGIVIPMVMPKVVIEPMSFTLASHVAIFIAVFMAPDVAVAVVLGTTIGFFVAGFPPVVVLRAASHLIFAIIAAIYVKKRPAVLYKPVESQVFSVVIGIIHALSEVAVVFLYYAVVGGLTDFMATGGAKVLFLLVGVGTLVHSMVDFEISYVIFRALSSQSSMASIFPYTNKQAALSQN
jgi:niacin transporter